VGIGSVSVNARSDQHPAKIGQASGVKSNQPPGRRLLLANAGRTGSIETGNPSTNQSGIESMTHPKPVAAIASLPEPFERRHRPACQTVLAIGFAMSIILVSFGCSKPPSSAQTNSGGEQAQENSGMDVSDDATKSIRRKAEAGVGKQGQKLRKHEGPMTTPVKAYFKAKQQLTFMNVQRALQMYEVMNGYPKTHDEFMKKIIQANNIELPELPEGCVYEFDTTTHELMVVGPGETK